MNDNDSNQQKPPRRRGMTSITLQWVAEKLRRAQLIKDALARGTYEVDSNKIAKAMLDSEKDQH